MLSFHPDDIDSAIASLFREAGLTNVPYSISGSNEVVLVTAEMSSQDIATATDCIENKLPVRHPKILAFNAALTLGIEVAVPGNTTIRLLGDKDSQDHYAHVLAGLNGLLLGSTKELVSLDTTVVTPLEGEADEVVIRIPTKIADYAFTSTTAAHAALTSYFTQLIAAWKTMREF